MKVDSTGKITEYTSNDLMAMAVATGNVDLTRELVELNHLRLEREEIKQALIEMRVYVLANDLLLGECVAWNKLKQMLDVARSDENWRQNLEWARQRGAHIYGPAARLVGEGAK